MRKILFRLWVGIGIWLFEGSCINVVYKNAEESPVEGNVE